VSCKIDPVIYFKPCNCDKLDEDIRECKGLKISRQLNYGRIEANIFGFLKDYDSMDFQYFADEQPLIPIEIIDIAMNYSLDKARAAIRKIIILDRDRNIKPESSQHVDSAS
jgi:hypothetical protein